MIFIRTFQKLNQFSGKVPIEHWVSRIAVNTCLNQIESERVRPELRHADLTEEEQAVVENLATSSEELAPDKRFASRQLVEHLLDLLKPAERLVVDLRFGITKPRQYTLAEVGSQFGITRERVRQIERTALRKLRSGESGAKLVAYDHQ